MFAHRVNAGSWLSASCALLLLSGTWSSCLADNKTLSKTAAVKAWHLELESSANGKYDFVIAPTGVKLTSQAFDITLVAKAPQWRFYAIRQKEKEIASCTLAQFKTMVVPSFTMAGITQELKKPTTITPFKDREGHSCLKYFFAIKGTSELFWQSGERDKTAIDAVEIESIKIPVEPSVEPAISRFLNLPALPGVPFGVVTVSGKNRGWQLRSRSKSEITVDGSTFDPPVGYRDRGIIDKGFLGKSAMNTLDGISDLLDVEKEDSKPKRVREHR